MTKTKSNFIFGTIVLVLTNLLTKVIGAIYRIPLLKILGSDGLGEYQIILPIYALFLVVSSSGIVVTMSKFISHETVSKNTHNSKKILLAGILLAFVTSVLLSVILIFVSPVLVKYQHIGSGNLAYFAMVPAIIFGSMLSVFRGYFLGKKQMIYSGISQVFEAGGKLVFGLVLSAQFVKWGFLNAILGALLGISISEMFAFAFSVILYFATKRKQANKSFVFLKNKNVKIFKTTKKSKTIYFSKNRYLTLKKAVKKVFSFSVFITLQACVMPLVGALDSIIIVPLLLKLGIIEPVAYSMFGIETGVVSSILALPTVISIAVGSSIIPNINKKTAKEQTEQNIKNAFNIVWLTTLFCAFVFALFSKEIILFLYGGGMSNVMFDELMLSSNLLKVNGINIVYLCLLSLSTSVLQGLEKNKAPVVNLSIAATGRFILIFVLLSVDGVNIYGTAIADAAFYALALILNLREIKKEVALNFGISKFFVLPVLSCCAVSMSMKLMQFLLADFFSQRVFTLLVMIFGLVAYLAFLSATKVLKIKDMLNVFIKRNSKNNIYQKR